MKIDVIKIRPVIRDVRLSPDEPRNTGKPSKKTNLGPHLLNRRGFRGATLIEEPRYADLSGVKPKTRRHPLAVLRRGLSADKESKPRLRSRIARVLSRRSKAA